MIVVVYHADTGAAVSIASVMPETVSPPLAAFMLEVPYAALGDYQWDAATRTLVPRPSSQRTVLTKLEFTSRLSLDEQVALELAQDAHPSAQTRATLRVLQRNLDRASEVKLDDPRTIMGAGITVDVLIGAGLVQPADRDARVAALLAPARDDA